MQQESANRCSDCIDSEKNIPVGRHHGEAVPSSEHGEMQVAWVQKQHAVLRDQVASIQSKQVTVKVACAFNGNVQCAASCLMLAQSYENHVDQAVAAGRPASTKIAFPSDPGGKAMLVVLSEQERFAEHENRNIHTLVSAVSGVLMNTVLLNPLLPPEFALYASGRIETLLHGSAG